MNSNIKETAPLSGYICTDEAKLKKKHKTGTTASVSD